MAKKKYYGVAVGRSCGIFSDWASAEKQVKGFPGAKFKSFSTAAEAEDWLANPVYEYKEKSHKKTDSVLQKYQHDSDSIVIYTDGGAINNPGPGGYGIVIEVDGKRREISGGYRLTTNNRMEMMAAIVALREVQVTGKTIHLYSDSSYLVNGIIKGWAKKWRTKGWRKADGKPVLNVDLWQDLLGLTEGAKVFFNWVKGHAGNELNEQCDRLAVSAAKGTGLAVDTEYERLVAKVELG